LILGKKQIQEFLSMTYPVPHNNYAVGVGTASNDAQTPIFVNRAPTSSDINYPMGKPWINPSTSSAYVLTSFSGNPVAANWLALGTGGGTLNSLSDGTTTVTPTAGVIEILGTASQITSTGTNSPGAITLSLPNAITTPGSLTTTTSLTAGNGFTVSSGTSTLAALTQVGTAHINITGAATTVIGTGGTGAVQIGNATGNTAVTGSLTTTTTLTATLGNITATNGNLSLAHAGNKLLIAATSSATCSAGTFTLAGAATTVVSNSAVTANSLIFLQTAALGTVTAASTLAVTSQIASTSFTVTPSQSTDTSTVNYLIIN
jgi:hypothetical protein